MAIKILKVVGIVLGIIVLLFALLVALLSFTEYKPAERQPAEEIVVAENGKPANNSLTVYAWNIGYCGLGEESDFFMDGGEMVDPPSQEIVEKNLAGIKEFMANNPADAWLLQEVDLNSARTGHLNEFAELQNAIGGSGAFAYNYNCIFVPIPVPPIGKMESGVATVTDMLMSDNAERISLPCPFSWPVSTANLKRCLLVTRVDVEGTDKELVFINLHLEAYDDGVGKIEQTKVLMQVLEEEYAKGNYVIAGGDFNQSFPGALDYYPIKDTEKWTPGTLEESILPAGWQFAYDNTVPTSRLLDFPYCEDCQLYVIDGFIVSPNVKLNAVKSIDLDFEHSDHNPVRIDVTLLP